MGNADLGAFLNAFVQDDQLKLVAFLVLADIILGVVAAVTTGTFRLKHISAFLRDDVLEKVVPWFALFALGKANDQFEIVGNIGFGALADAAFVAVTAALAASILKSIGQLPIGGFDMPEVVAGNYQDAPLNTKKAD